MLRQKIQDDFDRIALYEQEEWNHNNHYHNFLLTKLPSQCRNVLDIGCGTGEFSRLLAQRAQQVVAIDLSPNMIAVAQQRSKQQTNINFQIADIMNWEFPEEHFDAIVSIAVLHHLPIENLLPNLKAALIPGGKLVILDLLKYESVQDGLSDIIAVPLNWIFQGLKNSQIKRSPEAIAAISIFFRSETREFVKTKLLYLKLHNCFPKRCSQKDVSEGFKSSNSTSRLNTMPLCPAKKRGS